MEGTVFLHSLSSPIRWDDKGETTLVSTCSALDLNGCELGHPEGLGCPSAAVPTAEVTHRSGLEGLQNRSTGRPGASEVQRIGLVQCHAIQPCLGLERRVVFLEYPQFGLARIGFMK